MSPFCRLEGWQPWGWFGKGLKHVHCWLNRIFKKWGDNKHLTPDAAHGSSKPLSYLIPATLWHGIFHLGFYREGGSAVDTFSGSPVSDPRLAGPRTHRLSLVFNYGQHNSFIPSVSVNELLGPGSTGWGMCDPCCQGADRSVADAASKQDLSNLEDD